MAESKILTDAGYVKLLKDLRGIVQEGRDRAERAASQELVAAYWEMGKRISGEGLRERAGYGDSIMEDLAEDLGIHADTLRKSVIFFEWYKSKDPRALNLNWAHYRALLGVQDEAARDYYEKQAQANDWTRDELVRAIKRGDFSGKDSGEKTKKILKRPDDAAFVYKAMVEKVVDADTLLLRIDLGFQVWKEQRVRLEGLDAPPIDTKKGYEAFEFVRDQMAQAPFVMVKTNQIDIYGRYVAQLFYSFTLKDRDKVYFEGRWLNQELLDRGLAEPN